MPRTEEVVAIQLHVFRNVLGQTDLWKLKAFTKFDFSSLYRAARDNHKIYIWCHSYHGLILCQVVLLSLNSKGFVLRICNELITFKNRNIIQNNL